MKLYLILILLLVFYIIAEGYAPLNIEKFNNSFNIDIFGEIKSNISLKDFNKKFNTNVVELPYNIAAVGVDMDSDEKLFLHLNDVSYIYFNETLDYWFNNIHDKLNKRKYYLLLCYSDGYKFDEVNELKHIITFATKNVSKNIFTFSKRWNDKNSICIPDPFYTSRKKHIIAMKQIDETKVDWLSKKDICIWRGKLKNGHSSNLFDMKGKEDMNPRQYFVKMYREGKFNNVDYEDSFTSLQEQLTYKYILDIDGWSNTWDATIWKLYSGSILFKVKSTWQQWYYDELKEWEHYVPINNDFSDLNEKIEWCKLNDDKCKQIAKNAKKFVIEKLNLEYVNNKVVERTIKYFNDTNQ